MKKEETRKGLYLWFLNITFNLLFSLTAIPYQKTLCPLHYLQIPRSWKMHLALVLPVLLALLPPLGGLTEEIWRSSPGLGHITSWLIFASAFQQPFSQVQPKQVGTSHRSFLPTSLASPSQSLFPSPSLLSDLQSQSPWRPTSVFSLKYWYSTKGDFSPQGPIGIVSRHF